MPEGQQDLTIDSVKKHSDTSQESLNPISDPHRFIPDTKRVYTYTHLLRDTDPFNPDFMIPLGENDWMRYSGLEPGGTNDRTIESYQIALFPEEFRVIPDGVNEGIQGSIPTVRPVIMKENAQKIFEGYDEAFRAGKTVLDIASGQALALLQLGERFPDTHFIGIDTLYAEERSIYPNLQGVQLTKGDCRSMTMIPDSSIDTIVSVQGAGVWALPGGANHNATIEDGKKIVDELSRISKPGCLIRMDMNIKSLQFLKDTMDPSVWDIDDTSNIIFIARKKR